MGKYMRKTKTAGEIAVMEVAHQSSLGVRTRAKTLALQRLQKSAAAAAAATTNSAGGGSGSYLQLRSRRLEKPPMLVNDSSKRAKHGHVGKEKVKEKESFAVQNSNSNSRARVRVGQVDSESRGSVQKRENSSDSSSKKEEIKEEGKEDINDDLGIEGSFGENVLDYEGKERGTRESTPCSLIRDPEAIRTPGSSTRPASSSDNRRLQSSSLRHIPTAHEMDEFFNGAEEEQQKQFVEKYNFDPVNEKPLPGRFEWEKVDP